ncbi:alpha-glucosidase [Williamwhitmania taraxaci]|uniref:Alpha-glucosidase n=1 Tax=Williamwhitmania taraxaci TaxID=1640674 RepID=A0A1G6JNQ2_9BACT|nr:alpha-glucosidase [Williamwhitmania taraxaci]SDC20333.1 alpha-glucosidase [Williamwhitmania taraxaci]
MNIKEKQEWVWWKHGVIYQIYPRSFNDSNSDGVGDLPGIIKKIDYLSSLGIDAIWLSPIYTSPMHDFGYDISNYREIDPVFGTLNDFKKLLKVAHSRGIHVIMDMVLNHTSHLHQWFQESRLGLNNPKRDWYIWRSGRNGHPPNNWKAAFGGSVWEWDENSHQYYLHSFLKEQPDLNWRNKEVQKAFFEDIRFWLDMGVDGFRLDVINWIAKDKDFRSNPCIIGINGLQRHLFDRNRSHSHKIVKKLRKLIDSYPNRMTVGEVFALPPGNPELSASYLGTGKDQLNLAFDFSLIYRWWNAAQYHRCLTRWYESIPPNGWPTIVLSNHDMPRALSRFGMGRNRDEKAKVASAFLLTTKGTPFLYYGEEIGMLNIKLARGQILDPLGKRFYPFYAGRDRSRSPMQWDNSKNSGFSKTKPWMPLNPNFKKNNVKVQETDSSSLLSWHKSLIALRKKHKPLHRGTWLSVADGTNGYIGFYRTFETEKILVILNFTASKKKYSLGKESKIKLLLSSRIYEKQEFRTTELCIDPYEVCILMVTKVFNEKSQ